MTFLIISQRPTTNEQLVMAKSLPAAWHLSFPTISWFRVQPSMTRTNSEVALQTQRQRTKGCPESQQT